MIAFRLGRPETQRDQMPPHEGSGGAGSVRLERGGADLGQCAVLVGGATGHADRSDERAIDVGEGEEIDEEALKALIRAAVTLNAARDKG